jgi:hypothetical protein
MAIQKQEHNGSIWVTWVYISDTHSELLITDYQISEPEPTLEEKVNKLWEAHPELH